MFQLTAARRRLVALPICCAKPKRFQLTAARRRLGAAWLHARTYRAFQLTAARRRLGTCYSDQATPLAVSTHSRPKAAGWPSAHCAPNHECFNSQPPEGGWLDIGRYSSSRWPFQLTAARRRLALFRRKSRSSRPFQLTAARRRLATP